MAEAGGPMMEPAPSADREREHAFIPPWLLELLVCPVDRSPVSLAQNALCCPTCGRRYPVVEGILVMIPTDADEQTF